MSHSKFMVEARALRCSLPATRFLFCSLFDKQKTPVWPRGRGTSCLQRDGGHTSQRVRGHNRRQSIPFRVDLVDLTGYLKWSLKISRDNVKGGTLGRTGTASLGPRVKSGRKEAERDLRE